MKPTSGLIAVDPRAVDRKLRVAEAHLPRVFLTRRRRDSGRGERRRGVIDYGGHCERLSVARFRAHLPFPSCKLRVAADSRDRVASTKTKSYILTPKLCVSTRDAYQRSEKTPINGLGWDWLSLPRSCSTRIHKRPVKGPPVGYRSTLRRPGIELLTYTSSDFRLRPFLWVGKLTLLCNHHPITSIYTTKLIATAWSRRSYLRCI